MIVNQVLLTTLIGDATDKAADIVVTVGQTGAIWVDNLADQMAVGLIQVTGLVTILVNNFSYFAVSVVTEGLALAGRLTG
ncbi:hypothetical protein NFHSH190041_19300 [Shewanella sp. NFH-SH190041]|uniref:hypothetical protein n=1 Tax=Shewanella sp. NFH-SH190041 TaxID=2950245 RepID=UPI0021C347D8|nr:hypothetical protein [Shewanella sp. NFH-SH190041]BDM64478.1 hypothetical protein NFHSH190041_19300 [Shewanella sp. NFH-SH190041]